MANGKKRNVHLLFFNIKLYIVEILGILLVLILAIKLLWQEIQPLIKGP
jgi:hypothetical protein